MAKITGIKATVTSIVPKNKNHGAYAVAKAQGVEGSITFSLRPAVWSERSKPEPRDNVFLDDVRKNGSGFRSHVARFWRPSDEQK